jgi:hypothetical protein
LGGGKEISKEEPPWVTSEDFNEKTHQRIEKEKEQKDLTIKVFLPSSEGKEG